MADGFAERERERLHQAATEIGSSINGHVAVATAAGCVEASAAWGSGGHRMKSCVIRNYFYSPGLWGRIKMDIWLLVRQGCSWCGWAWPWWWRGSSSSSGSRRSNSTESRRRLWIWKSAPLARFCLTSSRGCVPDQLIIIISSIPCHLVTWRIEGKSNRSHGDFPPSPPPPPSRRHGRIKERISVYLSHIQWTINCWTHSMDDWLTHWLVQVSYYFHSETSVGILIPKMAVFWNVQE